MPRCVCPKCGTEQVFTTDMGGMRVTCRSCGLSSKMPRSTDVGVANGRSSGSNSATSSRGSKQNSAKLDDEIEEDDDEDEDEDEDDLRPARLARRRRKRNTVQWKVGDVALVALRILGYISALHGAVSLLMLIPILLIAVLWRNLLLGVIVLLYGFFLWIGMKGAIGWGITVSRQKDIEGIPGIILGIIMIEGVFVAVIIAAVCFPTLMPIMPLGNGTIVIVTPHTQTKLHQPQPQPLPRPQPATVPNPALPVAKAPTAPRSIDTSRGFSLVPPVGWEVKLAGGSTIQAFLGPVSTGFRTNTSFMVEDFPGSLADWTKKVLAQSQKEAPDLQVLSQSDFQPTEGARGIRLMMEAKVNGRKIHFYQYLFEQQQRKFFMIAGVPSEATMQFGDILDASARTFRFEAAPKLPKP